MWALPVTAAVSSFVAQTHVGYVVLAVPLIAWGAVGLLGRARRTGASRSAGVAVLATAAVLVLAWSPPVADEVLHDEGNLSRIVDWFGAQGDEAHSLPEGARVVTAQLAWMPDWITGRGAVGLDAETTYLHSAPAPLLLLPFAAAALVAWRRRWRPELRLALTATAVLGIGVVAVARTLGGVFDYRLRWTWVVGGLLVLVTAWTGWRVAGSAGLVSIGPSSRSASA